jgi:aarF domain-containing kinase
MLKVWMTLEARQLVNASVHDVYKLVKSDGLSPNY